MKKIYIKALAALLVAGSLTGCGDSFLDTDMSNAVDSETALDNTTKIGYALNGTYYTLFYYYFAGNYSTMIGDVASDISYWNGDTGHQDALYRFNYTETDTYLTYIWYRGYRTVDQATRVINAVDNIYESVPADEQEVLMEYKAEAYAMRGYARMMLANIYCHQIKVNGQDFSSMPGLVIADAPIGVNDKVSRATNGETWAAIVNDCKSAVTCFEQAGFDQGDLYYWNYAAALGLVARAQLYMENYSEAAQYAAAAIEASGITSLAYDDASYYALYAGIGTNTESMFALAINANNNWSANSCGTLWTTYNFSPAPKLMAMYGANDCRRAIMDMGATSTDIKPVYAGGKFGCFGVGNPAYATNYIVNAPEMFLIQAEAYAKMGDAAKAAEALFVVAHRNPEIGSVSDLPTSASEIFAFVQEERARELFQEGFRLYDLRRWDVSAEVFAYGAPDAKYTYTNYKISDQVFPIPADEINTNAGVTQNDWASVRPQ